MSCFDYKERKEMAKAVPIKRILAHEGHEPVKGNYYRSPLREDKVPSFVVYPETNTWCDFGLNDEYTAGDVINLVQKLHGCGFKVAVDYILAIDGHYPSASDAATYGPSSPQSTPAETDAETEIEGPKHRVDSVTDIRDSRLKAFLAKRFIPLEIANKYCREVHYTHLGSGRKYFGIGFPKDNGGWVVRSAPYGEEKGFKGDVGPKCISTIHRESGHVCPKALVFEGFFNFLSFCVLWGEPEVDVIILNSVTNAPALDNIATTGIKELHMFLDNDAAGMAAFTHIANTSGCNVLDYSFHYAQKGLNDLNDYLRAQTREESHPAIIV